MNGLRIRGSRIGLAMVLIACCALPAQARETAAEKTFKDIYTTEGPGAASSSDEATMPSAAPSRITSPLSTPPRSNWAAVLKRLEGIDVKALSSRDQINYAICAFHDAVLSTGSVLDAHIERWIAAGGPATIAD